MGVFDFLKSAGRKEEEALIEKNREMIKASSLKRHVMQLGIPVENLKITFDDGVATIYGTAKTQADRERAILAVGNTEGVAQVDDRMEARAAEPEATMYTVKKGDSLSKIAKAHYGDAMKYPVIFEANKPMLTDPDKIYPGQVLRVPALAG